MANVKDAAAAFEAAAASMERVTERKRIEAEYATRKWKASEIEELKRDLVDQPGTDATQALQKLSAIVTAATAEGRYFDDLARTRANLRNELGAGQWIFARREVAPLYQLADSLEKGAGRGPTPVRYNAAASALWGVVMKEGRIATDASEVRLGLVVLDAVPTWLPSSTVFTEGTPKRSLLNDSRMHPTVVERLEQVQRERWAVLEESGRELLDASARAEALRQSEPWKASPIAWPFDQLPGMSWEPVGLDVKYADLDRIDSDTRTAQKFLGSRARDALSGKVAQINADALSSPELAHLDQLRRKWGYGR